MFMGGVPAIAAIAATTASVAAATTASVAAGQGREGSFAGCKANLW